jgi:pyridinium-3,5-bisthiocarboxylic acid mononucleotide nickel chelatase
MIGWLHCPAGVSGDMLLGALVDAGVPLAVLQGAVDAVTPAPVRLRAERVRRAGLAATKVHVDGTESTTHRTWADIHRLLTPAGDTPGSDTPGSDTAAGDSPGGRAAAVFAALARAEGRVHGVPPEEIHFHEVGALDAIADVVAACAGLAHLGLDRLVVSPVALGGGTVRAAHGHLPVPGPAVVELLLGRPTYGGPVDFELTTPTGAALVATLATGWGAQPPMRVTTQGLGAGSRDLPDRPNVLRLLIGEPTAREQPDQVVLETDNAVLETDHIVLETNVDDLDPRLWPGVLAALLGAGADDAWLVPILMKKGRPAHTLKVLAPASRVAAAQAVIFAQTTAIGLRQVPVGKVALARQLMTVEVDGHPIRVKLARDGDRLVNAQPEWEDVAAAAAASGTPAKAILARAAAAYWTGDTRTEESP